MNTTVPTFLSTVRLGEPTLCDNLAMVPLFTNSSSKPDYITLEEGLKSGLLEVEELEGGASVNDILFRNKSDHLALLFEGEEFIGAMQNRVLNVSILANANSKQTLPVSCVEAGRWHHKHAERKHQKFNVANRMHYARGRAMENRAVSKNLETQKVYRGDQSTVWDDISVKFRRMNAESPTAASDALYVSAEKRLNKYVNAFVHQPEQVGSLFLIDDAVSGLEIFANEITHRNMLSRLIRSYALDAIDAEETRPGSKDRVPKVSVQRARKAADSFVNQLSESWTKEFNGVCLGQNVRFKDDGITGGALVHNETLFHLCAFAA